MTKELVAGHGTHLGFLVHAGGSGAGADRRHHSSAYSYSHVYSFKTDVAMEATPAGRQVSYGDGQHSSHLTRHPLATVHVRAITTVVSVIDSGIRYCVQSTLSVATCSILLSLHL